MPTTLQLRRGTTAENAAFTGAEGELTVDTQKNSLIVHDGTTLGGHTTQEEGAPAFIRNTTLNATQRHMPDNFIQITTTDDRPYALNCACFDVMVFKQPTVVTSFGLDVSTADAGSTDTRVGIYTQHPTTGLPDTLLFGSGALDVSATGVSLETLPSPITLHGTYWFAHKSDSAILFCRATGKDWWLGPHILGAGASTSISMPKQRNATGAFGAYVADGTRDTNQIWTPIFN